MFFVGIDQHNRYLTICVRDRQGSISLLRVLRPSILIEGRGTDDSLFLPSVPHPVAVEITQRGHRDTEPIVIIQHADEATVGVGGTATSARSASLRGGTWTTQSRCP